LKERVSIIVTDLSNDYSLLLEIICPFFTYLKTTCYLEFFSYIHNMQYAAAYRKAEDMNYHSVCLHVISDSIRRC